MTNSRFWRLAVGPVVGLALIVTARPADAQGIGSVVPWAGIYVPTKNKFSGVGGDIKRENSFIGGGRITLWGKSPLGLELSAGYAPANISVAGATVNGERKSNVFVGSLKLMLGLSQATSPVGIYIGAGPAVIRRGDDLLHEGESHTDFGGAIGAGVRIPVAGSLAVRFDAEDYLYGGNFSGSKDFQNDLALSAGLSLGL